MPPKRSRQGSRTSAALPPSGAPDLPLDLVLQICRCLPPNEIACSARLVCKASAQHFSAPRHRTVRYDQPVPPRAFAARFGPGASPEPLKQLSLEHKQHLFACTAATGSLENVTALVDRMAPPFWWARRRGPLGSHSALVWWEPAELVLSKDACVAAARNGHMHVVRWLLARRYPFSVNATVAAAMRHCALADALWLLGQSPVRRSSEYKRGRLPQVVARAAVDPAAPDAAAKLDWLFARCGRYRRVLLPVVADAAIRADNLPVLQRAMQQDPGILAALAERPLHTAAMAGAVAVAAWLLERQGAAADVREAADAAAWSGQAATLQLMLRPALQQLPAAGGARLALLESCMETALLIGRLEVAQAVQELGVEVVDGRLWGALLCSARRGDVGMARWLARHMAQPAAAPAEAAVAAAGSGSLGMLSYVREELGAPWGSPEEMLAAALRGAGRGRDGLAMLRWLHAAGCALRCSAESARRAAAEGDMAVLTWLHEHGLLPPERLSDAKLLDVAADGGCEAVVEWLAAQGCPMGRDGAAYLAAGRNGDLDMLRCLRRLGVPWGQDTLELGLQAFEQLPAHVVRWMVEEGGAPCDARAASSVGRRYDGAEAIQLRALLRRRVRVGRTG